MEWVAAIGVFLMVASLWSAWTQATRDIHAARETLEEILAILRERLPDPDPPDLD